MANDFQTVANSNNNICNRKELEESKNRKYARTKY